MKIRRLSNNLVSANDSLESISLSPKMQLIFGPIDADTTNVRDSIRWLFYGDNASGISSKFLTTDMEVEFPKGPAMVSRTTEHLEDFDSEMRRVFDRTLLEIDPFTYESFYDVNFGQGSVGGYELCQLLRKRFNVPFGDHSGSESDLFDEHRVQTLRHELSGVDFQVHDLSNDRNLLRREVETLEKKNAQPREFLLSQKQSLEKRIEGLRIKLERLRVRAFDVEKEIDQLIASRSSANQVAPIAVQKNNSVTASDLESLDLQINRWKTVQADINTRITDLKSDLSSTRISEFDGAFDEVRALLRCSEEKISDLDTNVDASSRQHDEFHSLQVVHHQICDALSEIQSQWRQRLISTELRDLHRCTEELNGYLQRLNEKRFHSNRSTLATEDSASTKYCECSSHDISFLPGNSHLIEQMNAQLDELINEIEMTQRLLNSALSEYHSIDEKADQNLLVQITESKSLLEAKNVELRRLQTEKQQLEQSLALELAKPRQRVSRCLQFASNFVSELTNGVLSSLYLSDEGTDIVLVDENRQKIHYNDSDLTTRNKVRIAISLAACSLLTESDYRMPLVLEDAFVGFGETEVDLVMRLFKRFTKTTSQIVLLTNNRFIRDYSVEQDIPCLDLPDKYSGDAVPTRPRGNELLPNTRYSVESRLEDVNRSLDFAAMDQNGTELVWQEDVTGKIRVAAELDHRANRIGSESSDAETESYRANILKATRNSSRSNKKRNYQPLSQSGTPKDTAREFDSENENIMHQASDSGRNERSNEMSREPSPVRSRRSSAVTQTSRFYLELNDNVEAAPTIGPKTAEHLEEIGIITVSELVETDPGWIANELSNKRIKEANVEQWQYQAMLVCQVPNLRGHDSQILVACGILDAEQLADMDPAVLFGIVGPFSKTKEGQKWLRGAKVPDLAEVTDWVSWAQEMRPLDQAA